MTRKDWKQDLLAREPSGESDMQPLRDLGKLHPGRPIREESKPIFVDRQCSTCHACSMTHDGIGFVCVLCGDPSWRWLDEPAPVATGAWRRSPDAWAIWGILIGFAIGGVMTLPLYGGRGVLGILTGLALVRILIGLAVRR